MTGAERWREAYGPMYAAQDRPCPPAPTALRAYRSYFYGDLAFREECIRQACQRYIDGEMGVHELDRVIGEVLGLADRPGRFEDTP